MSPRPAARFAALALLCAAGLSRADVRYDHAGAIGLLVGGLGEYKAAINPVGALPPDSGFRLGPELGATLAIGHDGNELKLVARGTFLGPTPDVSALFGYRNYFGRDQWKTFFDLDVAGHFTPHITVGARFGIGVQWDWLPIAGTYVTLAGQIGFGQALRFSGELALGFQFRTYVLD